MSDQKRLVVRAQIAKIGVDQFVLAAAISWVAHSILKLRPLFEVVPLQPSTHSRMGNYEEILIQNGDEVFAGSAVHRSLKLEQIAELLQGPLRDLGLGSRSDVRQELLRRFDELKRDATVVFATESGKAAEVDPSLFTEKAAEIQRWLSRCVDERLRDHDFSAWQ